MSASFRERRTQAQRRAASEAALLRAAAELIAERGIDGASLRSISARAGASRSMPAYHFGSKDALVAKLVERGHEQTLAATEAALERRQQKFEELSKLEALQVTIGSFLEIYGAPETPEERAVVVMWGATFPTEAPLPALVESDRQRHRDIADTIRAGQREGSIRADIDPDAAAVVVSGMARGAAALSFSQGQTADPARVRQMCIQAIGDVLAPRGKTARKRP